MAAQCRLILRELRARGIDPARHLALLGICYPEQEDLTHFISATQFAAFLRAAQELSGDPGLGLSAGERVRVEDTDLLKPLVRGSSDRESVHYCNQYRGAVMRAVGTETALLDGMIVCRRVMPGVPSSRILSEYFLARLVTLTRHVFGPVEPIEVRLMHARPEDIGEHSRILGQRLRFGQSEDALVLPAELLSRPVPDRDPVTAEVLAPNVARLAEVGPLHTMDVIARVRETINDQLHRGRVTMPEVASRLLLSERTLRRQLNELGTSFQLLLDEVRRDQALHYLQGATYSSTELSSRLGFNGAPAFYRAFRRWTGSSLRAYRQTSRGH